MRIWQEASYYPPPGWEKTFANAIPGLTQICNRIESDGFETTPPDDLVFRPYRLQPDPAKIKVWIIGMDPYPQRGQANGIPFSCDQKQPSCKNIFKELVRTDPNFVEPNHGRFEPWFDQGVFMTNLAPTTVVGKSGAHTKSYTELLKVTAEALLNCNRHIIIVLMGNDAKIAKKIIGTDKGHYIEVPHPSPLNTTRPFVGSNCFLKIDAALRIYDKEPVDWSLPYDWTAELEEQYAAPSPLLGITEPLEGFVENEEDFGQPIY